MKKVYVETFCYKPHSLYRILFDNPPKGYEFLFLEERMHHSRLGKFAFVRYLNSIRKRFLNPVMNKLEKMKNKNPDCDFVYSLGNIVSYEKPYIADFENTLSFMGWDPDLFIKNRKFLEEEFGKEKCKFLTTWDKAGKETMLNNLDCSKFKNKIKIVPLAVKNKNFNKEHFQNGKIRFLFLSSINLPEDFYMKGGKETLEIFKRLKEKGYKNIELNITGTIPKEMGEYKKIEGLNILGLISFKELDQLMQKSDILLSPIHNTPGLAFLDAMNYELAIITSNVFGNKERIISGKNGIIVPASKIVPYLNRTLPNVRQPNYSKALKKWDFQYVDNFVRSCENLINDKKSIIRMGKNGKEMIKNGRFSIENRNKLLKKLFDKI